MSSVESKKEKKKRKKEKADIVDDEVNVKRRNEGKEEEKKGKEFSTENTEESKYEVKGVAEMADVVRIVLQFLKEQNCPLSFDTLQKETGVTYSAVDSLNEFQQDIIDGKWGKVIAVVNSDISTSSGVSMATKIRLFEHVTLELLEKKEREMARNLLHKTPVMQQMRLDQPNRYARLENLLALSSIDSSELYPHSSRSKERKRLSKALSKEVDQVKSGRLLEYLNQALKWQAYTGQIERPLSLTGDLSLSLSLFREKEKEKKTVKEGDRPVTQLSHTVKFGKKTKALSLIYSNDGSSLITGSSDGFIEVWETNSSKLRKDLEFQENEEFMLHEPTETDGESGVTSLASSDDGEALVSGGKDGSICVWLLSAGRLVSRFPRAHKGAVLSICLSPDASQIVSCSSDGLIRVHGLKSGRLLKSFPEQPGSVVSVCFAEQNTKLVSACVDGLIRIYDFAHQALIHTLSLSPDQSAELSLPPLVALSAIGQSKEKFVASDVKGRVVMFDSNGKFDKQLTHLADLSSRAKSSALSKKNENKSISELTVASIAVSAHAKLVYVLSETGQLFSFNSHTGAIESELIAHEDHSGTSLAHHPFLNRLASLSISDRHLRIFRP